MHEKPRLAIDLKATLAEFLHSVIMLYAAGNADLFARKADLDVVDVVYWLEDTPHDYETITVADLNKIAKFLGVPLVHLGHFVPMQIQTRIYRRDDFMNKTEEELEYPSS